MIESVFIRFFNASVSAGVLAAAVVLIRAFMNRSPKSFRMILWAFVALRLVVPVFPKLSFSVMPKPEVITEEILYDPSPRIDVGYKFIDESVGPYLSNALTKDNTFSSVNKLQVVVYVFSVVWAAGAFIMLLYGFIGYIRLKRRTAASVLTETGAYICDDIPSPFILGSIRPKIYIPSSTDGAFRTYVEAHEKAHIKRLDHIWKPFGFLLLCAYWFNPLIWVSYILFCKDIELSCDEKVVSALSEGEKIAYADALLSFGVKRTTLNACPLAFGEVSVKERVKKVLYYKKPAVWAIAAGVLICLTVLIVFLTDPKTGRINVAPENVSSVQIYNADRAENTGVYSLGDNESRELIKRLNNLDGVKKGDKYAGLTPYYSVSIKEKDGSITKIRGYNTNGSITDIVFRGKTYVVKSTDFSVYIRDLCFMNLNSGGSEREYVSLDEAIKKAVYERENGSHTQSGVFFESHRILKTDERDGKLTVYAWILSENYIYDKNALTTLSVPKSVLDMPFKAVSGSHYPAVLTFKINENGYELSDYRIPRDGSYYVKDLKELFPKDVYNDALDSQKYIMSQKQENYAAAIVYYNADTRLLTEALFDAITDNPAAAYSSDPYTYIKQGDLFVRELEYYGVYTLKYVFEEFNKGGQTDLKSHIMRYVMDKLIGGEAIKTAADTGQDYYDEWIEHNEKLLKSNGAEFMKEHLPFGYMALSIK